VKQLQCTQFPIHVLTGCTVFIVFGVGGNRDVGHSREEALNPGNNLYVTGLSTRVTEKDLEEHFSKEGKVTECRLVVDPRTRESRGFGFVTMENPDDADRTVKYLNRTTLEGRVITVEKVSSNLNKSAGELNFSH
jgi:transformer-2 protein